MLEHTFESGRAPDRVVVIGAGGFIGSALTKALASESVPTLALTRSDIDLQAPDAADALAERFEPGDAVVAVSAIAPCKDLSMLQENLQLMASIGEALQKSPVAHIVNIGSDAVYADSDDPLTESSRCEPDSMHGIMHWTRHVVLRDAAGSTPYVTIRPTLVYGLGDPHNGYGPNPFRRLAADGETITLFGEGEEQRDHILIDDVATLIRLVLFHRSTGVINAASGVVISFQKAAEAVVSHFDRPVAIQGSPRQGPMPHGGYRPFDIAAVTQAFPDFTPRPPQEGFSLVHENAVRLGNMKP